MSSRIGRFFSPSAALLSAGIFLAGLLVGAYGVYLVVEERRISIGGFLLAGALIVGSFGALTRAFPEGCAACKKPFTEHRASFPTEYFDPIQYALTSGDAPTIARLASIPMPAGTPTARATLVFEVCPACTLVGTASVAGERWTGQDWNTERVSPSSQLLDQRSQALAMVFRQRGARI